MIIKFLLIYILTLTSSKTIPSIKAGFNTSFDYNNKEFTFDYKGPGHDLILLYMNIEGATFHCTIECSLNIIGRDTEIGEFSMVNQIYYPKSPCYIKFDITEEKKEAKGSFVIYNFNKQLSIKLKNKYGNVNLPEREKEENSFYQISHLTFSVPNLDRDVTVKFEYNKVNEKPNETKYIVERNPFKVCRGNKCEENITLYEFKKGESYKIFVDTTIVKNEFNDNLVLVPGFTFYDVNYDGGFYPDDIIEEEEDDNNASLGLKINKLFQSLIILFLIIY